MNAAIQDRQMLLSLSPLDVAAYLRTHGWEETAKDSRSSQWVLRREGGEIEVLLPHDREFRDYRLRMGELLQALELAEQRPRLQILADIAAVHFDVIRLRRVPRSSAGGAMTLNQAVALLQNSRSLLLAAACATVHPKSHFHYPIPEKASQFVEGLRVGSSLGGNDLLSLLSPLSLGLSEESFGRRVTQTLMQTLAAVQDAAVSETQEAFDWTMARGVSSNFCAALANLLEETDTDLLEVRVSWAPSCSTREDGTPSQVHLSRDLIPMLRQASQFLEGEARLARTARASAAMARAVQQTRRRDS
ncbi:MAG TPA: hypothetical protein VHN15_12825 [Thermoanaerobaculia bacterium]|nr:hypothetical protein [Thermoanaerobaculia bacterium]